ncbi:Oidioi.mRNA.OKI2018_I69.chr1.g1.t1.cds [Oikopleura dioica]|uniref:Oidioi.mRNA.OKI2018_I69.chr1.g1.t1.cds n=1 Tax=Oikopleura dioica TaxID=34765 RepID=A0ABN7SK78_OIKDI|nr:Oidioi.mRNA.OKI2018_I69.chr1.g1.t1.cds [Oikopleura dioica]
MSTCFLEDDTKQSVPNLEAIYKAASKEEKKYMNDEIHENASEILKKLFKDHAEWKNLNIEHNSVILSDNTLLESAFSTLKARQRVDTKSLNINIYRSAALKISKTSKWLDDEEIDFKKNLYTRAWCSKSEQLKKDSKAEEEIKLQYLLP